MLPTQMRTLPDLIVVSIQLVFSLFFQINFSDNNRLVRAQPIASALHITGVICNIKVENITKNKK